MRIGIEARFMTHPQRGGFKSYTNTLIASLAQARSEDEFYLYTDRPATGGVVLPSNFVVKPVQSCHSIVREQLALPRAMNRDGVDVAHFPCNTAPIRLEQKMVVTIHDTIPLRTERKDSPRCNLKQRAIRQYWRATIPRCARRADLVVADSAYVRDDLRERLSVDDDRLKVVPLPIDPTFLSESPGSKPSGLPESGSYVLAFASADGRKNHHTSIRAFDAVKADFPATSLVLVCSHPSVRQSIEADCRVVPIGPVSFDELVWLYRNALSLIFPSFDEGFGLPPLEAMACGTPVVVSDAGSLPEVVGPCGLYASPADTAGFAAALRLVMSDAEVRQRLIISGRARASRFTRERMGAELTAAYAETTRTPFALAA